MGPVLPLLPVLALLAPQVAPPPASSTFEPDRQVRWEHSLEDALALARAEGRQLLIAVNADGESASEAIVRERYRDPAWVANTRPFVCVVASFFRHTLRDYDDQGRRISCPRLGEVTCGEHIALEPLVHDGLLRGTRIDLFGEQVGRISPRHALVSPDGAKAFDLFLLFDLGELDRALAAAAADGLGPRPVWGPQVVSGPVNQEQLRTLVLERDGGARSFLERWLQRAGPRDRWAATTAILHVGDGGSLGALRVLVARAERPEMMARLGYVAATLGLEAEVGAAIRTSLYSFAGNGPFEGAPTLAAAPWLGTLGRLAPEDPATRDLLLPFLVFGSPAEQRAGAGCASALGLGAVPASVASSGGHFDLDAFLEAARLARDVEPGLEQPEPQTADELIEALEATGARLQAAPGDPALQAELGRGLLALARRRIEDGGAGGGIPFLLEDARDNLLRATNGLPGDPQLWLDLARVAYYRSDFDDEQRYARSALEALDYQPGAREVDAATADALRWLGDAIARRLPERTSAAPELRAADLTWGIHALAAAAIGPGADATDWESLASFCRAVGRPVAAGRLLLEGLQRYPESDALRALFQSLFAARPVLVSTTYHELARQHRDSAACAWYVGLADLMLAEHQRRAEQPWQSDRAYLTAEQHFERTIELNEGFRRSSEFFLARCALGRGFAHLLYGGQVAASYALVDAARVRPRQRSGPEFSTGVSAAEIGDGLGREAVDLVDGVLELRASGPSPVDPLEWLDRLAAVDPGSSAWPRMVSDAELREALRAVGRGEPDVAEAYVRLAVEAARRAVVIGEPPDTAAANGRALAQAATVLAELLLEPEQPTTEALDEARALAGEAGPYLDLGMSIQPVEVEGLRLLVAGLREALGFARPVLRTGR